MFNKQKKPRHAVMLRIVNMLQKEKIGSQELLEEIKLDLEENIPLSAKKVEFLKVNIAKLKEAKKGAIELGCKKDATEDADKPKTSKNFKDKKPYFALKFGKKSHNTENKVQNPEKNPHVGSDLPAAVPTTTTNSKPMKKTKPFSFPRLFKNKHADEKMEATKRADTAATEVAKIEEGEFSEFDDVIIPNNNTNSDARLDLEPDMEPAVPAPIVDPEKPTNERHNVSRWQKQYGRQDDVPPLDDIKYLLKEINREKNVEERSIGYARQLDGIKDILEEINREREALRSDVDEVKFRFSSKALFSKYDEIEEKLRRATDSLYAIQSDVYERIKEVRMLRTSLDQIKEDLSSL